MDWIQLLSDLNRDTDELKLKFGFFDPVPASTLNELREQFNLTQLPPELEELYSQTDGVDNLLYIEKMEEWIKTGYFIWPAEKVIEINIDQRTDPNYKKIYKSFDHLFFFADAGNGDLFGFETGNGKLEKPDVYVWNHEDDARECVAPNMKAFIEGWANGSIKV